MSRTAPDAASIAFRKAQALAAKSRVVTLQDAPLDTSGESGEFYAALEGVRTALVAAYRTQGARHCDDPHSKALLATFDDTQHDVILSHLNYREEAGYLYGLAVGLL